MKLLWFSNSPWASTGYGNQTKLILPYLAQRYGAADVACSSNFGLQGGTKTENGIRHYPSGMHPYSDDVAPVNAQHFFGDAEGWVITLFDVWVFKNPMWKTTNVASWVPVDHDPVSKEVVNWFAGFGAVPVAMSRFGEKALTEAGLKPLYAPHGIDTATFHRSDVDATGKPVREVFGIHPDRFVVGMVANNKGNNPPRKGFGEAFLAFSRFLKTDPDALLYVHSDESGAHQGINLSKLAVACGIPERNIEFQDGYTIRMGLPDNRMAQLYSSFDVLLAPSYGEGFGIPVVEAQACGLPVIVSDFSAQSELMGDGWLIPTQPYYDAAQETWFGVPAIGAIHEALIECHGRGRKQVTYGRLQARTFAEQYDMAQVWQEHWVPVLDELEGRLPGSTMGVEFAGAIR